MKVRGRDNAIDMLRTDEELSAKANELLAKSPITVIEEGEFDEE